MFIHYATVGVIITARKFDREQQREYAVTVTATDQAADPLIGICQLNILILDENDNSPKFENLRYECKHLLFFILIQPLLLPFVIKRQVLNLS